jgi:hypothetical protein
LPPRWQKKCIIFDYNYERGEAWYRAHFPTVWEKWRGAYLQTGEASPYYLFYPHAAARAHDLVPRAKIIALLRHPVERAYSHYHHQVRLGLETLSFEEALDAEATRLTGEFEKIVLDDAYYSFEYQNYSYLARGMYANQLTRWFKFFPRAQCLILESQELYANPGGTVRRVLDFLEVPPGPPQTFGVANDGSYEPMLSATRARLADFFAPHNERLYELLEQDFGWE